MAKLNISDKLEVPEGVTVTLEAPLVKVVGPEGTLERRMSHPMIKITLNDKEINLELKKGTKREKMMLKTFKAHLRNMMKGATEKYVYKLKICSGHFPMNVSKEGNKLIVNNFL